MKVRRISKGEVLELFARESADVSEALELWARSTMDFGKSPRADEFLLDRLRYLLDCIDQRELECEDEDDYREGA